MTKKEIKESKLKYDARLNNILKNGKEIGYMPIIPQNKYYLLDNIIWYIPRGDHPINNGTLQEFKNKIKHNIIRIRLIVDIDKL